MKQAIEAAVRRLGVVPFFPPDADARLEIMHALEDMIGAEIVYGATATERLNWLVSAAINAMRTWGGIPELRGLLCSKWKPADRIEGYSSLPGYTAEDSRSLTLAEHRNRKAIEAGQTLPKLLEAAACDRMPVSEPVRSPEDEVAQRRRATIGKVIETARRQRESLAAAERELASAPRNYLTEEQKALRLAALQAGLKAGGN